MTYYILFMCFLSSHGFDNCSTAQFPDLKQCQYSAQKVKDLSYSIEKIWCQEVRK